jgi:hypothetical protein
MLFGAFRRLTCPVFLLPVLNPCVNPQKCLCKAFFRLCILKSYGKFFFFWPLTDPVCAQLIFYLYTRVFLGQILRDEKGGVHLFRALEFFPKSPAQTRFLGAQIALTRLFTCCKPTNYPPSDRRVARTRGVVWGSAGRQTTPNACVGRTIVTLLEEFL